MCGIAGYIDTQKQVKPEQLLAIRDLLAHRGPDDAGIYISDDNAIGLAHRRLSFLDLSQAGKQPMLANDGRYAVSFNGEIYNYRELKIELEQKGYQFLTETDTEILLHGYSAWGNQLPQKLKGMFAFAIYDHQQKILFLARDRFGIKPLFYGIHDNIFVFASELKSILSVSSFPRNIRKKSVGEFLANRYIPTPHTMWENIFKLPPAHWMEVKLSDLNITKKAYWKLQPKASNISDENVQEHVDQLLSESLKKHLLSDVQIGSFLSGGMDSSALVMLMKEVGYEPIDTFSIGFENWDESEHLYAKKVADALQVDLHTLLMDKISLATVEKLMYHYDDPIADISILPTYAVSGLAVKTVKAVVSGEGADESFGGYWWHQPSKFHYANSFQKFKANLVGKSFSDIKKHYIEAMSMGLFDHDELQKAFTEQWNEAILEDPFSHFDQFEEKGIATLKQIQYLDIHTFMSELILTKVDRASMAHSLEVRVPFLDHELVEYMFTLPEKSYFDPQVQKSRIRNLLAGKVPQEIYERKKQGFVGPDKFYMDMEVYASLQAGRLVSDGVIKKEYVQALLQRKDHWRLWKLFVLENWWKIWV